MLPLTISSILGAVITAVSSRMRHKSLAESLKICAAVHAVTTKNNYQMPRSKKLVLLSAGENLNNPVSDGLRGEKGV